MADLAVEEASPAPAAPPPRAFAAPEQGTLDGFEPGKPSFAGILHQKFVFPPFTLLDARMGGWKERKKKYLALGIKSEVGRGANLLKFSDTLLEPDPEKREQADEPTRVQAILAEGGRAGLIAALEAGTITWEEANQYGSNPDNKEAAIIGWYRKIESGLSEAEIIADALIANEEGEGNALNGTSVFDPVLCELAYKWFCPLDGVVVDPFAGGSVRGIMAAGLERAYWGSELREEQVQANRDQVPLFGFKRVPVWVCGDSTKTLVEAPDADFVFSCPPYGSLERYSDDPLDLSTMTWDKFVVAYRQIVRLAVSKLRPDRFACFVVGDFRNKDGWINPLVTETIDAFEQSDARLYNHALLLNAIGSAAIRATRIFNAGRKLVKLHQNVLVFAKGDPIKAASLCMQIDANGTVL